MILGQFESNVQNLQNTSSPTPFVLTHPNLLDMQIGNLKRAISDKCSKGTPPIRKIDFFRALPKLPLPPPPPNSGKLYNFFWTSKTTFLRVLQNQVTMITTMM